MRPFPAIRPSPTGKDQWWMPKGRFVRRKEIMPNPEPAILNEIPDGHRYLGPVNPG
jgi:hypothetical protein